MSYHSLYIHIVIVVRFRAPVISAECESHLLPYINSVITSKNVNTLAINAALNHIHMLVEMPTDLSVADLVRDIKRSSSLMMKNTLRVPKFFGWAREYAALSVSRAMIDRVKNYINNQKEHHRVKSFDDEFLLISGTEQTPDYYAKMFDR